MKNSEVQTLGELRMHDTNWWAGLLVVCVYLWSPASSTRRVWHGLATVVDTQHAGVETCRSLWLPGPQRYTDREEQVTVSPMWLGILAFSLVFTAYLSNAVVSGKSPFYFSSSCVVLKPLLSLIGCLVACSVRISVDTHADQNNYCNLAAHACRGLNIVYGHCHIP